MIPKELTDRHFKQAADEFNAVEAKKYFQSKGYEVIDRRAEAEVTVVDEDDESAFPEGQESFKIHRHLERDGKIPRKAKAKQLAETGELKCEVCEADFHRIYGKLGHGFIEAHHTMPVSKLNGEAKTKISDLALVCSNCHLMLHRGKKLLTVKELREILHAQSGTEQIALPPTRKQL
jgi:predicted HNH restriction endonuclease